MFPDFDHTELEKRLIEAHGGAPLDQFGPDGQRGDQLMEVRLAKKEDRFRINKDTHRKLVRSGGVYLFDDLDDGLPPREVPAREVSDMLGRGSWHSDRGFEHRFLAVDDVFPPLL